MRGIKMTKFDTLFNKIIKENVQRKTKKVLKEDIYDDTIIKQKEFQVFYDCLMTTILDMCDNVKQWGNRSDYNQIAKDFITDYFMEAGEDIIADLYDNVCTQEEFESATPEQQDDFMLKAINGGGWISLIDQAAEGYADQYQYPTNNNLTNDPLDTQPENPEDNIEEVPEDFRQEPVQS